MAVGLVAALAMGGATAASSAEPATLQLEQLTSTELQALVAAGTHSVLLPIGGTEQNGPHLALGKHNERVKLLAERIARALGRTLVAPVLAYVPEGEVEPATEHMRYPGTISIPSASFEALLAGAARSLCRHGLRDVVLLGDHGGYHASLRRVAQGFKQPGCRVHVPAAYYQAASAGHARWLREQGHAPSEIGRHAGLADTSLSLALTPGLVRSEALAQAAGAPGVDGDPRRASAALGQPAADRIVSDTVAALKPLLAAPHPPQK